MKAKKLLSIFAIGALMFSFTACGSNNNDDATEETQMPSELATEEAVDESVVEAANPDNQSFDGEWEDETSQRAYMQILEDGSEYKVTIIWGSSATDSSVWTMSCEVTEEPGHFAYTNGAKYAVTTDENGNENRTELYTDASGELVMADGYITWKDDKDQTGKDCKFVKVN